MDFIIGADFVPTKSNVNLFEEGDIGTLFGRELNDLFSRTTYKIFNLEMPLCDTLAPINKCGPNLYAPTKAIKAYQSMGVSAFTLANNHITDQGTQGLKTTISLLEQNGIKHFGAGNDLSDARKPFIVEINEMKVGFYACAENEFSIATERLPGACPFDPLISLDEISELKKKCNYVVVLYHGGKEHYKYPSPQLQKVCRRIVDKGADIVLCQHSHCIGCEEKYSNGRIIYGQGNFLFDDSMEECWQTGLLVGLDVGESLQCKYYPIRKTRNAVRLAEPEDSEKILADFFSRSEEIKKTGFVEKKYGEFADSMLENYLIAFSGKRSWINRILNRLSGYRFSGRHIHKRYDRKTMTIIRNFVECEAHRELSLCAITRATEGSKNR